MDDVCNGCARYGVGCGACEQTAVPGELPTGYVSAQPRTQAWVPDDHNAADALEPRHG